MKKTEMIPRSIEGDWDWRRTYANLPKGWTLLEEKSKGEHVWSFIGNKGTMLSTENGRLRYVAEYRYRPDALRLALVGWRLDKRGEREMRICEWYRVEFPDPAEMHLYDLEDIEPGEEELLRLVLRKVPVKSQSNTTVRFL